MLKTSLTIGLLGILLSSINVVKEDDIDASSNNNKTIKRLLCSKNLNRITGYLTSKAKLMFTKLSKAFTKALIFQYFDLKYHIQIETNASGYAIGKVLH